MAQSLPRKRSFIRNILLAFFCVAVLAWFASPRKALPIELHLKVNENHLLVPADYIPRYMLNLYGQAKNRRGLLLQAEWKKGKLQPYIDPHDNTAIWISHQDEVSILVQHFRTNTPEEKYQLSQRFTSIWMPKRKLMAGRYGLLRYEHNDLPQREKEDVVSAFYEQDLYLYPSRQQIETQIVCDADVFPDPGTARAAALQQRGKFVINPRCSHEIFFHGLKDSHIQIGYFRSHLHEWREIEQAVVELLDSFRQAP